MASQVQSSSSENSFAVVSSDASNGPLVDLAVAKRPPAPNDDMRKKFAVIAALAVITVLGMAGAGVVAKVRADAMKAKGDNKHNDDMRKKFTEKGALGVICVLVIAGARDPCKSAS